MAHLQTVEKEQEEQNLKAIRRMKERTKMQRYRQRLVAKMSFLRDQARKMEEQIEIFTLQKRSSRTLLPWQHIADALREEVNTSTITNASLKSQCDQHAQLIHAMKSWVTRSMTPQKSPRSSGPSWRNMTLSATYASRRLGFNWITQYLFHNTENTFQRTGFPTDGELSDFFLDMTDPSQCQYVWRSQRVFPASLEYVREEFARPNILGQIKGKYLGYTTPIEELRDIEVQDDEVLREIGGMYTHTHWGQNALMHFLAREFNTPNRCIIVAQNINDDEALPNSILQRNRFIWIVLDRLPHEETRVRGLCINSHGFTKDGYVSFEDEAHRWGCDLGQVPDDLHHTRFYQRVQDIANRNGNSFGQEFYDKVRSMQKQFN